MPYYVICDNCGLLLYSAAVITERVCQRCGADLPEAEQGAPPDTDDEAGASDLAPGGSPALES